MEHAIRIGFQAKTRDELAGPFWAHYKQAVKFPKQWDDSDGWLVNYVGHPITVRVEQEPGKRGHHWLAPVEKGSTTSNSSEAGSGTLNYDRHT